MNISAPLFEVQGKPVYRGDILYHPDARHVSGKVTAEFAAEGEYVTVRCVNGAVPSVRVADLSWTLPPDLLDIMVIRKQRDDQFSKITQRDLEMWRMGREAALKGIQAAELTDDPDLLSAYLTGLEVPLAPNADQIAVLRALWVLVAGQEGLPNAALLDEMKQLREVAENNYLVVEAINNYLIQDGSLKINHDGEGHAVGLNIIESIEALRAK